MANLVYPAAIAAFMQKVIDIDTDDVRLMLVKEGQSFSGLHEFVSDLTGSNIIQRMTGALAGATVTFDGSGAVLDFTDPTFLAVPAGGDDLIVILYSNVGGADSARRLIAYIDTGTNIPRTPDGDDIPITFSNAASKVLRGV